MSISKEIMSAGMKYQNGIKAAELAAKTEKAALDKAMKSFEQAQDKLYEAQMEQYNARIAIVKKHIDEEIMTMKAPTAYDKHRVAELRAILANIKEQKYQSYDKRFEILKALRELQLIVTTFPFVKRVGGLIKEWTGKSMTKSTDIKDEFYPFCWRICHRMYVALKMVNNNASDFVKPWYRRLPSDNRQSIINVELEQNRSGLAHFGALHNFWEIECCRLQIRPEFVVRDAPSEPVHEGRPFPTNCRYDVESYINSVNRIGRECVCVNDLQVNADSLDEIVASVIIAECPSIFTVKETMSAYDHLAHDKDSIYPFMHCQMHVKNNIQFMVNQKLITAQKTGIECIRFDYKHGTISWSTKDDDDSVFDPDTCEMRQPSRTHHELDVSDVPLSKVAEYAFRHIKGLSPHE